MIFIASLFHCSIVNKTVDFLAHFLLKILINVLAIFLVAYLIPGINFTGDFLVLLLAALVLGLINTFLKPVLKKILAPFIWLSLGLCAIVINSGLLWLLTKIIPDLTIASLWAYLEGGILLSIINILTARLIKKQEKLDNIKN